MITIDTTITAQIEEVVKNNLNKIIDNNSYEHDVIDIFEYSYLGDGVYEMADSYADIYTDDLFDWAKDNVDEVNEILQEWGNNDIVQAIQGAQVRRKADEIYEEINDVTNIINSFDWVEDIDDDFANDLFEVLTNDLDAFALKALKLSIKKDYDNVRDFIYNEINSISLFDY